MAKLLVVSIYDIFWYFVIFEIIFAARLVYFFAPHWLQNILRIAKLPALDWDTLTKHRNNIRLLYSGAEILFSLYDMTYAIF